MTDATQQVESVSIMTVVATKGEVSIMITYKGGNNRITHLSAHEVVRQFGSYLTAADRQRLTPGAEWVHKHKHKSCTIL
jgi:hypothetical protein